MGKMFGTAGIRGLTLREITPSLAERIGRAYGNYLENSGVVVIGRDTRWGAEIIEYSVVAGLMASGIDVLRCGCIPTPALARFIEYAGADGAVMITGSHTPPDRIGIIVMLEDSSYVADSEARQIEQLYDDYSDPTSGNVKELEDHGVVTETEDALAVYSEFLLSLVDIDLLESKPLRIVIDPANGTASQFVPELLRELGHDIITINDQPSGNPGRPSEPRPWTLETTAKLVKDIQADLGIAYDVDADRVLFIDENGEIISTDVIGSILMELILKENPGTIVLPVNTSGLAEAIIARFEGSKALYCPIGQPATIDYAKKNNGVFAYEESGKYYFTGENILWTDGTLAALRILEVLLKEKITLSQLVARYPKFYTKTINITVPQEQIKSVTEKALEEWKKIQPEFEITQELTLSGGTRQNYKDNSWLLLRPSGTEPLIRVVADAPSLERTEKLTELGKKLVIDAMNK